MSDSDTILKIEDYSLSYASKAGEVRILDDINLQIRRGEVLGLVGESGSAKSSLANAIMRDLTGKVASESGKILLSGTSLVGRSEASMQEIRGNRIAIVLQNASTALNPTMTIGDHIIETLQEHGRRNAEGIQSLARDFLDMVGLPDPIAMMKRYAHEVSGGEKQRVVLAMAFACDPELILFDEPTSALDATTAATLLDLFIALQHRTGVSALFISHDLGVVSSIANSVAVIYGGRIVEHAATDELFREPRHPYTRSLLASLPRPSDTRTGRQLATAGNKSAPRIGPAPPCIYAGSCAWHEPSLCDRQVVRLPLNVEHAVACVKSADVMDRQDRFHARSDADAASVTGDDTPVLAMNGFSVTYGKTSLLAALRGRRSAVHAVNDVSLALSRGETLALVGESGCGKSTLAKTLAGLVSFEGELLRSGVPVHAMDQDYRARVQIVFQNPDSSLNPRHAIGTILERPLVLYRKSLNSRERKQEVGNLLRRVQLPEHYADRYPHQLSGGEKQRVAIARALAAEPEVIICDEVTSGLDASVQASITQLLRDIQLDSGTALIFITHDLAILRHLAHRVAVMYLGELIELMDIDELDKPPYHPYTEALLSSSPSIDPLTATRRIRLHGTLPKRTERISGCVFESRCPHRLGEQCATERPPRQSGPGGHEIQCHISMQQLSSHTPVWRDMENPSKT
ncbi:dipeptide ABC transporter ATP-binding protein [Granulosicoccus sp. 3-233]|uniref:dipeptide ABC transporter ATP-binding protein n=1 Tax=Granulosicoccus sp. 3-233 TaxID=3417969 RepID=UPI003D34DA4D